MVAKAQSCRRIAIKGALESARRTEGSTHNFYLYPARFSPEAARTVISTYSDPNDWILDPFMGGGTAVVEGLMAGRKVIGTDLNALGHFVATVRTTPLSDSSKLAVRKWATKLAQANQRYFSGSQAILNLPRSLSSFAATAIECAKELHFPRERSFARCALLRLGQWALDCRDCIPGPRHLAKKLPHLVNQMLDGLDQFVERCSEMGVDKNEITSRRLLRVGDARTVAPKALYKGAQTRPTLIFTSPPYPRVHVLYHRWQVFGRSETPAPYWIADVHDGYYASHYTGGSRTPTGERQYFQMIREVFSALRSVIASDATVAQLVGFANVRAQLPMYLRVMSDAGYDEESLNRNYRIWRRVPNRKWHARLQGRLDAASEVFLLHHPVRSRR